MSNTGTTGRAGLRMQRGDPGGSDEGRGAGGVARRRRSGREPLNRPLWDDTVGFRLPGEGEPDRCGNRETYHRAAERHAIVVERGDVRRIVAVIGFPRLKRRVVAVIAFRSRGIVVVRVDGMVFLARDVRLVGEGVQHGYASRDQVRDQRKAGDKKPPAERARMHRHARKVAPGVRMRQHARPWTDGRGTDVPRRPA